MVAKRLIDPAKFKRLALPRMPAAVAKDQGPVLRGKQTIGNDMAAKR